jgi:hypothetical protein
VLGQQIQGARMICNECETVAHCTKHGCIPKQSDYKGAIEVSVIFHEGQRMFAVPKQVAQQQEPNCKQDLQVWVQRTGQFSWEPQDERFWTRMQPAQQEPVAMREVLEKIAHFLGIVRIYAQDIKPKHELETDKPMHWKARELQDQVISLLDITPPAQRKPLTGEEMNQIEARWEASMHGSKIAFVVRETEAAHNIKEKNYEDRN